MNIRFVLIVSLAILLTPVLANAVNPCSDWYQLVADGRVSAPQTIDNTGDWEVGFYGIAGHSYSLEVNATAWQNNLTVYFANGTNLCQTADGPGWVHTEYVDPSGGGTSSFARASIAVSTSGYYGARVSVSSGSYPVTFTLSDTTMYSPRWSTWSGFYTSYGLTNTTSASVIVGLKFVTSSGSTVATYGTTISAGRNVFVDTRNLSIAANQAGQAILTHNGPPGAILADGFIQNPVTGAIQPVKFEVVRSVH